MIAEVNALVLGNRRITMDEIHGLSVGSQQTDHLTAQYSNCALSPLQCYHEEECGFLSQIVIGDETRGHRFEPESKRQSKQWKCATSPPPKKSKTVLTSSGFSLSTMPSTIKTMRYVIQFAVVHGSKITRRSLPYFPGHQTPRFKHY
ncbi:uncharacterized protein TNCV_529931 [Trichonephila clavipes]|nr:uncharacterized protein TNCV_529931 [Trichonephila clavipes]